jgi:hypothetical protein
MGIKAYHLILLLLTAFFLYSCEDDPVISLSTSPQAIIFGVFDKSDNIHYLKVGKTFQSDADPVHEANIFDSLYFDTPDVTISLTSWNGYREIIKPSIVREIPKDEGIFHNPDQLIYCFEKRIRGTLGVSVKYPGIKEAYGEIELINSVGINTPKRAQTYLYLAPDSPIRIQWIIDQKSSQDFWFEIDVSFGFIEEMEDTIKAFAVKLQNTNWNETMTPKYQELSITYDEFIREIISQMDDNPEVLRRYFGYHSIKINSGDSDMTNYIKYLDGYNDYDFLAFSNITDGIGLLASRSSASKDSMQFDYETKQFLVNENRLKRFKFIAN